MMWRGQLTGFVHYLLIVNSKRGQIKSVPFYFLLLSLLLSPFTLLLFINVMEAAPCQRHAKEGKVSRGS